MRKGRNCGVGKKRFLWEGEGGRKWDKELPGWKNPFFREKGEEEEEERKKSRLRRLQSGLKRE